EIRDQLEVAVVEVLTKDRSKGTLPDGPDPAIVHVVFGILGDIEGITLDAYAVAGILDRCAIAGIAMGILVFDHVDAPKVDSTWCIVELVDHYSRRSPDGCGILVVLAALDLEHVSGLHAEVDVDA